MFCRQIYRPFVVINKVSRLRNCCRPLQLQKVCYSDSSGDTGDKRSKFDIATPKKVKKTGDDSLQQKKLKDGEGNIDPKLVDATYKVAKNLKGNKDQTVLDLFNQLTKQQETAEKQKVTRPLPSSKGNKDQTLLDLFNHFTLKQKAQKASNSDLLEARKLVGQQLYQPQSKTLRRTKGERSDIMDWGSNLRDSTKQSELHSKRQLEGSPILHQLQGSQFQQTKGINQDGMKQRSRPRELQSIRLSSGKGLGIFTTPVETETSDSQEKTLFDKLEEKEMKMMNTFPPRNAFEEEIEWSKQGKMWKFPVDNEEGMEEERTVGFHEHVFLDEHLQGFPENRAVRYFMDLVILGLSKNPYLTVGQKLEHIHWYREYFSDKVQDIEQSTVTETLAN